MAIDTLTTNSRTDGLKDTTVSAFKGSLRGELLQHGDAR